MAVPLDDLPPQDRTLVLFARRLADAGFERLGATEARALIRPLLMDTLTEVYGQGALRPSEGLVAWFPLIDAAYTLERNLVSACAKGALTRYFQGLPPMKGVLDFKEAFHASTRNLFKNIDQLLAG